MDRPSCTGTTKSGSRCKRHPIVGGTVCKLHGGGAPQVKAKAAVRAEVLSWRLGDAVDDPGEVLLRLVTQSRMRADQYAATIETKVADAQKLYGENFTLEKILIGDTLSVGEFGDATKTGEYIRGLIKLEADERDRLAGFAAKAIAAGLAERQVRLAERQGEALFLLMSSIISDPRLALSDAQRKAMPDVVRTQLALAQQV